MILFQEKSSTISSPVSSGRQVERTRSEPSHPAAVISGGSTSGASYNIVASLTPTPIKRASSSPKRASLQFDTSLIENAGETIDHKSYNGAPNTTASSSSDLIQRIQPSGRNSSGWL